MSQLAVSRVQDSPISGAAQNNRAQATQLIRQATDPRSGAVDTQQLARWTVDAQRTRPENASEAYAAVEAELANQNPIDAGNFAREVVSASQQPSEQGNHVPAPSGQWATGQYLANRGDRTLINNPILEKRWGSPKAHGPAKTARQGHSKRCLSRTASAWCPASTHRLRVRPRIEPATGQQPEWQPGARCHRQPLLRSGTADADRGAPPGWPAHRRCGGRRASQ